MYRKSQIKPLFFEDQFLEIYICISLSIKSIAKQNSRETLVSLPSYDHKAVWMMERHRYFLYTESNISVTNLIMPKEVWITCFCCTTVNKNLSAILFEKNVIQIREIIYQNKYIQWCFGSKNYPGNSYPLTDFYL